MWDTAGLPLKQVEGYRKCPKGRHNPIEAAPSRENRVLTQTLQPLPVVARYQIFPHAVKPLRHDATALENVFVLQRKPQESIGALATVVEFAAHAGAVVLQGSVVNGKLGADLFAGFTAGD